MDTTQTYSYRKPKLGLALSGGGARGFAHIGVLKALEEANIRIDFLSGTSMGGVIAAAYASGMSPEDIEAVTQEYKTIHNLWRLADPSFPRQGIFQGERLLAFFEKYLNGYTFEDARIPLTLVAVDLNSGQEVHIQEGSLAKAVRATVSIPGVFAPVKQNGQCLVDGGLLNNLPVDVVRDMGADIVLAVDVFSGADDDPTFWQLLGEKRLIGNTVGGLIRVLGDSLNLVIYHQNVRKLQESPPDFTIRPKIPINVSSFSGYDKAAQLIVEGVNSVSPILNDLHDALEPQPVLKT
jgi:predicted acylesterase/phospholipase RssA